MDARPEEQLLGRAASSRLLRASPYIPEGLAQASELHALLEIDRAPDEGR
jgi:hypothetical protein